MIRNYKPILPSNEFINKERKMKTASKNVNN